VTEDEARKQFARTPEAQEIWARVGVAYDTGADPWPIREEYDAAEAAWVAAHATTPDEPDFHDRWQAMTAEEQHQYMHGGEGIDPETGCSAAASQMGWHEGLYRRARFIMRLGMWHPDGGNGRVPYHTLTDAAPQEARDLWAEIDANHSRAMARTVKQNILDDQRRIWEAASNERPAERPDPVGGDRPADPAGGGVPVRDGQQGGALSREARIDAAIGALDRHDPSLWTRRGKPKVRALEAALGFDITAKERNRAWKRAAR